MIEFEPGYLAIHIWPRWKIRVTLDDRGWHIRLLRRTFPA